MSGGSDLSRLWWPKFDGLYGELIGDITDATPGAAERLASLMQRQLHWLQQGLESFKPPADQANSLLQKDGQLLLDGGKKLPIKTELRSAALALSKHLSLNELQAYILIYRWPGRQATTCPQQLNLQQLQELEVAYFVQRSNLLRSIEALVVGPLAGSTQHQPIWNQISSALRNGLDRNLCSSLANNFEQKLTSAPCVSASCNPASASYADQEQQSQQCKQQLLLERDILLGTLISIFADWKPCTRECFTKLMPALHQHSLSQPAQAGTASLSSKTACLAQILSVQLLSISSLFTALSDSAGKGKSAAPMLASHQDSLADTFRTWLSPKGGYGSFPLTKQHGPALLGFAAIVTLCTDIPGLQGPLVDIDPNPYANKAAELGVLSTLAELSKTEPLSQPSRYTLLSLMCAAIAAFELSPLTLPADQLQAVVKTLANLYEGHKTLCEDFFERSSADCFWHAPVRNFYEQLLQLFYLDPKPVLRLWHALATGPTAAESVVNMLENPIPPAMFVADPATLDWLNKERSLALAAENLPIPASDHLYVQKGTRGQILPQPLSMQPQQGYEVKHPKSSAPEAPPLVLWLPATEQPQSKGRAQRQKKSEDQVEGHMQPGTDALLARGWLQLQLLQQAPTNSAQSSAAVAELLPAFKLLARLAKVNASIGQDLLRAKPLSCQSELHAVGADALDLVCQTLDWLCQLANPSVELLGVCMELIAAFAQAFPGYVAKLVSNTILLGRNPRTRHGQLSRLTASSLPVLEHAQRVWEGALGRYPVTMAFLTLSQTLVVAGVNEDCVKAFVGFTLSHILSSCHTWRYTKRSHRWSITGSALELLCIALTSPLTSKDQPSSTEERHADWSLAEALAEAVSRPGGPAGYLFVNLPPHAGVLDNLVQRQGREAEADAIEAATAQWLQLLPALVQACTQFPYPSALLHDLFQAPADKKPSAATILLSYIAYRFQDSYVHTVALEAGQALAVATASLPQGQICFARCFSEKPSGTDAQSWDVQGALTDCFQYEHAVSDPATFAAAAQLLITAFTAPHPSLLQLLLTGSLLEKAADKENSSHLANSSAPLSAPKPAAAKAGKDSRPTCLDGIWSILQHYEELQSRQPEVLAHALNVVAIMWQAGPIAAAPVEALRSQLKFLESIFACTAASKAGDSAADSTDGADESIGDLLNFWEGNVGSAWLLAAEAHALTVLSIEAFSQPRESGQADKAKQQQVWVLLDKLASDSSTDGGLLGILERYSHTQGSSADGQSAAAGAERLYKELFLEAEAKMVSMFSFMANFEGDDLEKHLAGHTLLAGLWQKLDPLLEAFCRGKSGNPASSRQRILTRLQASLAAREYSKDDWRELLAKAYRYREVASRDMDHQQMHEDAELVLLLHDMRQLRLTDMLLHSAIAHHCSTLPRQYGEGFQYSDQSFEDAIGQLMVQRAKTNSLHQLQRACSVVASVQDTEAQAVQALASLAGVTARASPSFQPLPVPSTTVARSLACLQQSVTAFIQTSSPAAARTALTEESGLLGDVRVGVGEAETRAAAYAKARHVAQIALSHVRHWRPTQTPPAHQPAPAPEGLQKPPRSPRTPPSRLALSSSAVDDSSSAGSREEDWAVAEHILGTTRCWLEHLQSASPDRLQDPTPEPITQSLLSGLMLVLHRIGAVTPPADPAGPLRLAAQALLPTLCQLAATHSCHANAAASVMPVMLRACQLSPSDWLPCVSNSLHLVHALSQAFHVRATANQAMHSTQPPSTPGSTPANPQQHPPSGSENLDLANAELEGTWEGALLALALLVAQTAPGAQMLMDQGISDFIPALAQWLLSPAGGDLSSALLEAEVAAVPGSSAFPGLNGLQKVDLGGMYSLKGYPSQPHLQWGALLSLTGVLVRSVDRDARLDRAVVTLLTVAADRMLAVLTPPEAVPHQPLTLALLQEVEKTLFLVSSIPHLKGQWQMASQGNLQGPGLTALTGPLAMRQATCTFLEFAALAVQHQSQHPCCPPVSRQETSLARMPPHLPLAQAWFRATAVGSAASGEPQLGPDGSMDLAAVAATEFSCQVAETMYSCVALALKLLIAFCPEGPLHQGSRLGPGWPQPSILKALQKQCHVLGHSQISHRTSRALILVRNVKRCLLTTQQLLQRLAIQPEQHELKNLYTTLEKLQSYLDKR